MTTGAPPPAFLGYLASLKKREYTSEAALSFDALLLPLLRSEDIENDFEITKKTLEDFRDTFPVADSQRILLNARIFSLEIIFDALISEEEWITDMDEERTPEEVSHEGFEFIKKNPLRKIILECLTKTSEKAPEGRLYGLLKDRKPRIILGPIVSPPPLCWLLHHGDKEEVHVTPIIKNASQTMDKKYFEAFHGFFIGRRNTLYRTATELLADMFPNQPSVFALTTTRQIILEEGWRISLVVY